LFDENYKDFFDSSRNPNAKPNHTQESWVIDDIESTPANSPPPTRAPTRNGWRWARRPKNTTSNEVMMEKTNMTSSENPTQIEEGQGVSTNPPPVQE
jgi:hypothetical protein